MKYLSVLGSTGSIGKNVVEVVRRFPDQFSVKALAAATNIDLLREQIIEFRPDTAVVLNKSHADSLKERLPNDINTSVVFGDDGYLEAATHNDVDMVVSAIVGSAGLKPTVAAIKAGKDIALANKETLVMAGDYVMALVREHNVTMLPVDSEHSAVFQCLEGQKRDAVSKLLLTASGGPFRDRPVNDFQSITLKDALAHPTWSMGKKISVDSATIMNKGLEVIEAKHLFNIESDAIEVVIHPQSIIHSMVAFHDGSVLSQMGVPDMKGAIAYALSWPERLPLELPFPDFADIGSLTFETPDTGKFPCLALAYEACRTGHTLPAVMNAANETAVQAFLDEKIKFTHIPVVIEKTMVKHQLAKNPDISDIISSDTWARETAGCIIETQLN